MLFRWLRFRLGERVEVASRTAEELASLRSRLEEVDVSLKSSSAAEAALRRRAATEAAELRTARERLLAVLERLGTTERTLEAERDRADRAEAQALAGGAVLAERERELDDARAGRAELQGRLEHERTLRLIAEEGARLQLARDAVTEQRLRGIGESVERGLAALREQFAEQRELIANLAGSLELAITRLRPPLQLVPPPRTPDYSAGVPMSRVVADVVADQHLRFFATSNGYQLLVVDGAPPEPGAIVDVAGYGSRAVVKVARSPLPNDKRCCAYLLPLAPVEEVVAVGIAPTG